MTLLRKIWLFAVAYLLRVVDYVTIFSSRSKRHIDANGVKIEHIRIPSRDKGRSIRAIRYSPVGVQGPLPVHLNWHASGWVLKRLGLDQHMCVKLAKDLQCIVLDCDYRKAPEHKFPAAHDDTEDAVLYAIANPSLYDAKRLTVGGSSAGGNMALSISAHLGPERVKGCFALYPAPKICHVSEVDAVFKSTDPNYHSGVIIPNKIMAFFLEVYANSEKDIENPRFSPILYPQEKFPKHVLIACGSADSLFETGRQMLDHLHDNVGDELRATRSFMSIPQEAHEFNNFPKASATIEWRNEMEEAAKALIRASWSS
ncbi:hypothetical protein MCAP1_002364 [Malassezia caprae]|uniref:Alpha/beta hydrolase fold-3 domain-containing protein n=1 Tax=Malassezia caprae TaxID=1381934 RepID=A0AAF0E975_9BASI|nr:hypothetical protein MCAP1_002364 [Malassezia caprae]